MLDPDQRTEEGRLRGRVFAREAFDLIGGEAHNGRHRLRRVIAGAFDQGVVSHGVARDVVEIDQGVAHHHVHHRESQRRVASGFDLQVPVRGLGGTRANRIDNHKPGSAALRFAYVRPVVEIGDDGVSAPQHDVAAVDDVFRVDTGPHAEGRGHSGPGDTPADRSLQVSAAHDPEETAVDGRHLDQALHSRGAVRHNGLGSRFSDDSPPSTGDVFECLVPRDALEASFSLSAHALHGMEQAVGVIDLLEVVVDLRAQPATGERMRFVALQPGGTPVLDFHHPPARIGAIVSTCAANGVRRSHGRRRYGIPGKERFHRERLAATWTLA